MLMKRFLLFLTLLFLVSCMDVDDFGTYWAKTEMDERLTGGWQEVKIEKPLSGNASLVFAMKDGSYEVTGYENGKTKEKPYYPVRTLKAGPYLFLAVGPKEGGMIRYSVEGNRLSFYHFDGEKVRVFLDKNFPAAENTDLNFHGSSKIGLMNDTTYRALSAIPDTPDYWEEASRYEKQP